MEAGSVDARVGAAHGVTDSLIEVAEAAAFSVS